MCDYSHLTWYPGVEWVQDPLGIQQMLLETQGPGLTYEKIVYQYYNDVYCSSSWFA